MLFPKQQFSTVAQIHPNVAPHLRSTRRMPLGWMKPLGAAFIVGYGVKTYLDMTYERRLAQMQAAERENSERRLRNEQLEDAYGERGSLNELEKACQYYEKK